MNDFSITKSNALIEAGYRLTRTEIQIILYGISLINPTQKALPLTYRIETARFAEMFNRKHGEIYNDIKDAVRKRFWERDFSYTNQTGKIVTCRWLTQIIHEDKSGYIEIKFSEDVQPYLHQLKKQFTTYYIDQIARFKSVYSVRFYEFSIMQLKKQGKQKCNFKITIEELKQRLDLKTKYNRFSNFKAFVLEPAKKEINKHSDIKFSYSVTKQGRTPKEIKFIVSYKENKEERQLPLLETIQINLSPDIIEKAKSIISQTSNKMDIYDIAEQFKAYAQKNGKPDNVNGAFIGFVKKKIGKTV